MKKILMIIIATMICMPCASYCQNQKIHPVDKWFNKAMDGCDGSTYKINEILGKAYVKWDKALNKVYKKLRNKLNSDGKKALRQTQLKWIRYKETKEKNIWRIFNGGAGCGGTMDSMIVNEYAVNTVRERTLELEMLLRLVEGNSSVEEIKESKSPDGKLKIVIKDEKDYSSTIYIKNSSDKVIFKRELKTRFVEGHAWTPDSKYIVFTTLSSGGHSPWKHTALYYSVNDNEFGILDNCFGATTASEIRVSEPDYVYLTGYKTEEWNVDQQIKIKMSQDLKK